MSLLSVPKYEGLIDRDAEVNELISSIKDGIGEVNILFSPTGIGKSSLVKKLIYKLAEMEIPNVILIKTLQLNSCVASSEWLYIDFIFDAFHKFYENAGVLSFQYFLASGNNKLINKQIHERGFEHLFSIDSFKQLLLAPVFNLSLQSQELFEYNPYKISADNSMFSRINKSQYIKYVLDNDRVIFIMDNFQNIDSTSLKFFLDWLNETKQQNHYFLLEYTITESSDLKALSVLREQISDTGVNTKCVEVEKMSPNFVADVIENQISNKPTSIHFNLDALQHYELSSNGNLRDLLDYVRNYDKKPSNTKISSTAQLIASLSPEAKCVLAILVFCGGKIKTDKISIIWNDYFDGGNLSLILKELNEASIILLEPNAQTICIAHSSLIDEWESNLSVFSGIDRIVFNRLEMICNHILQNTNIQTRDKITYYEAWQYLLQIYAKREPAKINRLLEELESGIIYNVSAANIGYYIELFVHTTEDSLLEYKEDYYRVLSICYKLGLFSKGMECLSKMESKMPLRDNKLLILYKINYLTGLDRFDEAIKLYQWASSFISKADPIWYNLNLCILCSYRSINRMHQCKQIGRELTASKIRNCAEYAYHLRLMNIYLSNTTALKYAYRSAKWFESHGDHYQAGKSYITYSKLLASVGKYSKAIKYSVRAQNLLVGRIEVAHFIYSNLAAYKLLQGESGVDIWQLLCQAELSATVPYSQLAIIVNKLAWCYENKDFTKLELLINNAKKLLAIEPDKHIQALYYYNMYLISAAKNDNSQSEFYYQKASALQNECRFIAARISGAGKYQREIRCRLKKPWHVCFLSFWTYDLPSDDRWITSS